MPGDSRKFGYGFKSELICLVISCLSTFLGICFFFSCGNVIIYVPVQKNCDQLLPHKHITFTSSFKGSVKYLQLMHSFTTCCHIQPNNNVFFGQLWAEEISLDTCYFVSYVATVVYSGSRFWSTSVCIKYF